MNIDRRRRELLDEFRRGGSVSTAADYAERKPMTIDIPEGYESLGLALGEAVAQAARGKGSERHAEKDEPFSSQLICAIPKRLGPGGECFCLGQAVKKICESRRLPPERARAELLGAINYLAAAWGLLGGFKDVFGEALEQDAPRTKEELLRRIRGCNPAVYAPEDFQFDEARMRDPMPGIVPQNADTPVEAVLAEEGGERFVLNELVEYEAPDGSWLPACLVDVLNGKFVLMSGGSRFSAPFDKVRKAEKAG